MGIVTEEHAEDWSELAWKNLIYGIDDNKCIPFIGAGASDQWIHLNEIVKEWATQYSYPYSLEDYSQLPRVAQFVSIKEKDELIAKKNLSHEIKGIKKIPDFSLPEYQNTVYSVLADLNLPIYITTNYDHLMEQALKSKGKEPKTDFSRWNENLMKDALPDDSKYVPDTSHPLVFHLHGDVDEPSTMVLTEKDFIDFAIYLSKSAGMGEDGLALPHSIRRSIKNSTPLFLGYRLEDISFIIVFEAFIKLMSGFQSKSIAVQVQMPSKIDKEKKKAIQQYLTNFTGYYFKLGIYWGNPETFLQQLRNRWVSWLREQK